ncbi:MAG: glycosyl hydrolase family 18 protein, partial [Bacilli bacterium]
LLIEIGDSKQSFELSVGFKRYEDMSDEEYMALSPEEQDQVWEEHLAYQAELRHLEVERIVEFANNLPTEVSEDIELILGTLVPSVWVSWESNFPGSISNTGKVMKKTYDTVVTLTLTVWSTEESVSVSREILVKGFDMEPLPTNNLTFAYLPPYNFQGFKEEDIKKVDVINFAAGSIGASHQLVITSTNVFFELLKLREQGLKIVVCVQGGSWFSDPYTTIFEDMAINPENRAAFVQSVVDAIEMYDFDGIDIDWEIPAPNNAQYFTALVRDLREAFDKINPELIVSAAVPNSNLSSNFEYDKIGQYMDYLHLMNYDLGWKERTSHNSVLYSGSNNTYLDLSVDKTVNVFKSLGFPKEKMVIGSAFYGKIYKNVFTSGNGLGVSVTGADNQAKTINYHDVYNNYLTVNPQYIRRDEIAHADYYYDNVNGIFITYESFNVLREKTQYVVDNELAGIMFWDYNQDQTGDLLQAIYQTYPTR